MNKIMANTAKNIRRTPYQALAAITVLTLTLALGQLFAIIFVEFQTILHYFETRPQVSAYFADTVSEEDILKNKQDLEQRAYISQVSYISKSKALEMYRQQNQNDPLLLEMIPNDVLPASLEVSPRSVDSLPQIRQDLTALTGVEEVVYQQDVIEGLTKWTNGLKLFGIGLIVFLLITSLLNIIVIISMKVAMKRQEINIMQLLGANRFFIVGPFVLEGGLYGLIAAFLAAIASFVPLLYITPYLLDFLDDIPFLPANPWVMVIIVGSALISGTLIGMIGAAIAVRRYVK